MHLGSLVLAITTAIIGLVGATAMAGAVGGGGIGDLALVYGYQRFDTLVIIITVVVLVIIVQIRYLHLLLVMNFLQVVRYTELHKPLMVLLQLLFL